MPTGWITGLSNIARHFGICRETLYSWMKKFKMPIIKVGGKWCGHPEILDAWLTFPIRKEKKRNKKNKA
jgi:hypothetical protein